MVRIHVTFFARSTASIRLSYYLPCSCSPVRFYHFGPSASAAQMDLNLSKADTLPEDGISVSLPLFSLINQARNEHGMRQQDFHRYRLFCSTKVHRLRETLNKTHVEKKPEQQNKKNQKTNKKQLSRKQKLKAQSAAVQSASSKGKGHVFARKSISVEEVQSDRPLQLLLFEAERAWAYSQELKQEAFEKEQDASIRKHGLSRVRKGVQWAKSLADLVTALGAKRVDVMSRAEVTAYHCLLRGYESFDKNTYQSCVEQLSVARKLLYAIADACSDSRKEALANSYVDSTEAMLRFCAYNLDNGEQDMDVFARDEATPDVCEKVAPGLQKLVEELQESKKGSAKVKKLDSITWHKQSIPIRNPELVDVILQVNSAEDRLRKALEEKENRVEKKADENGKTQKRQRLSTAQRNAKRRTNGVTSSTTTSTSKSKAGGGGASVAAPSMTASKTEMDGYDSLLAALTEGEDAARKLVRDNAEALARSHSSRYEAASTDLVHAHEYLLYKLLSVRVERNAKLIEEVQEKGERRQKRAHDNAAKKLEEVSAGPKPKTRKEGSNVVRRRALVAKAKKARPAAVKSKKTKKRHPRAVSSPASRSKGGKKPSLKKRKQEESIQRQAQVKAQRITVRSVPGVAKLLDSCEMSCSGISTLGLVESEANVSTLMEAKSAWYKSELLKTLAKSYSWNKENDKCLLLLNRSELFVREARSAMELVEVEEVEKENAEVQPVIDEAALVKSERAIEQFRRKVQKDVFLQQQASSGSKITPITTTTNIKKGSKGSASQSKANMAINDMAVKYVAFDPIDLQQAVRLSAQRETELWQEVRGVREVPDEVEDGEAEEETWQEAPDEDNDDAVKTPSRHTREISMATTTVSDDFDDKLVGKSNDTGGAYDPANLVEDDEDEAAASQRKAGWLGGWFGRK